jgi:hypothetical protein
MGLKRARASATFAISACRAGARTSSTCMLCWSAPGLDMWKTPTIITSADGGDAAHGVASGVNASVAASIRGTDGGMADSFRHGLAASARRAE